MSDWKCPFTLTGSNGRRLLCFEEVVEIGIGERTLPMSVIEGDATFKPILSLMGRVEELEKENAELQQEIASARAMEERQDAKAYGPAKKR